MNSLTGSKLVAVMTIVVIGMSLLTAACTGPVKVTETVSDGLKNDTISPPVRAKNVIIMVGDGMGVSTVTAARWYKIQHDRGGLYLDSMPYTAVVGTNSSGSIITDSAAAATAIFSGQSVHNGQVNWHDGNSYRTILEEARLAGKSTGIVTTTKVTHATPACTYASIGSRSDETDIALQLRNASIDVIMGGGYSNFIPDNACDPEYNRSGARKDGKDLIAEFEGSGYEIVWNDEGFDRINTTQDSKVLALFDPGDMKYESDRSADKAGEPSLSEMTAKSIKLLSGNSEGFFLVVEGGLIDYGHHENRAGKAIVDTVEFDDAVRTATSLTDMNETLIIVITDHSHTLMIAGSPSNGEDILGTTVYNGKRIPILSYAVGSKAYNETEWKNLVPDKDTRYPAGILLGADTHGGETVIGYAAGPGAEQMHGTIHLTDVYRIAYHAMSGDTNASVRR